MDTVGICFALKNSIKDMDPFITSCKLFGITENEYVPEDLCIFRHSTISSLILGDLNCLRLDVIPDIIVINTSIMQTIQACNLTLIRVL